MVTYFENGSKFEIGSEKIWTILKNKRKLKHKKEKVKQKRKIKNKTEKENRKRKLQMVQI